jgi:hypothetical protein
MVPDRRFELLTPSLRMNRANSVLSRLSQLSREWLMLDDKEGRIKDGGTLHALRCIAFDIFSMAAASIGAKRV